MLVKITTFICNVLDAKENPFFFFLVLLVLMKSTYLICSALDAKENQSYFFGVIGA